MNPTVSVIVPVYNASATVESVLDALLSQSYPAAHTELIFVDNGSLDDTTERIKKYPVMLLSEGTSRSPYPARNLGIRHATGEIIAFTDANKIPDGCWIEEGVSALQPSGADLAGGDIQFNTGSNPGAAELYDSLTFNNNRYLVEHENGAACGNLFVKREVIQKTGLFPAGLRSGMDIWWTQKAVRSGCRLIFAEKAVVRCIPRKFPAVVKKSYRVGVSHPVNMKSRGVSGLSILWTAIKTLSPPRFSSIREKLNQSPHKVSFFRFWAIAWISKAAMAAGRFHGFLFMNVQPKPEPRRKKTKKEEADT